MDIFKGKEDYGTSLKKLLEQLWEYQEAEANLMVEIATLQYENGDTDDAVGFLERSVKIYHELGFIEEEATILDLIGDVYSSTNDVQNALDYYYKSFKICSSLDTPLEGEVLNKIKEHEAEIEATKNNAVKKAIAEGGEDALLESEESGKPYTLDGDESIDHVKIGKRLDDIIGLLDESAVYSSYQEFENPLVRLKEAHQMASSIGDEKGEAALLLIMGDISLKEEKTKKSLEFFQKSLKSFMKIDDKKGESISRLMMGTAYFLLGETDEGSKYLRQSMEIIKHLNDPDIEKAALALLKSIYD
ncbi:tetratricopeptide repeat protein [Methanobacterium sp.]|uniref:tetratricopeptide repeat protein n=1 Tax=Methanobacterium sp. TaxID=2164 RepID=UPI0025DB89F1|nr:tetratricopeptide repeat protein [Methanobacterium sp.]MBI5459822.1 tetratricopeptide repeat protein [Methanobacterium sp.]MDY9923117.1 tetratricopeptide repeat protein [Methanobacterium sp.]